MTIRPLRLAVDHVEVVGDLDADSRIALGYVAAELACVIEANYPGLDRERIGNMAIEFAYRLHLVGQEH